MKKSSIILITSIAALLLVGFLFWLKPSDEQAITIQQPEHTSDNNDITESNTNTATVITPTEQAPVTKQKSPAAFTTGLENLPRSLQGTQVDGEIIINENKELVVTRGLRRLFDYFLSTMGEEDPETIHARVEAYITSHTPEPAASSAVAIYKSYVAYLKALSGLEKNYGHVQMQATQQGQLDLNLVKQRQRDNDNLRLQYFDKETISAFFGDDDAFENYTIAMMEVNKDESLSEEQKQAAKEAYIAKMPDSEQKQNLVQYNHQQKNLFNLLEKTEEMKKNGASAEELFQMRASLVGEAAAQRLAKVDEADADFEARFQQYAQKKQTLHSQQANTETLDSNAQKELDELVKSLFTEAESKRLDAYEKLYHSDNKTNNNN